MVLQDMISSAVLLNCLRRCQREIAEAAVKQRQGGQPGDVIVDVAPTATSIPPAASTSPQQPGSRQASLQGGSNAHQQPA